eukprot:5187459-Pleurochrysis_carterae.AAC.2
MQACHRVRKASTRALCLWESCISRPAVDCADGPLVGQQAVHPVGRPLAGAAGADQAAQRREARVGQPVHARRVREHQQI